MTTTRRIACFDETHGQPHWSQTGFTSRLRTTNFAGVARILEEMDLECVSATAKPLTATFPETRLVVIPPPTGIYDAKHECWHRDPASLFTAQELCALLDFVADGGSVLAFSYRFGDAFTQTNLGLLALALGCLLNDDAILDLMQLKAPNPLATHFHTTVGDLPSVWSVAGIRELRWRCLATFSILPGTKAWPLVLSPALGSLSYHARLRQISYQPLPLGVAGISGNGRFALFGGPHAFETSPLGLLDRADNARFLRHVLVWLLAETWPQRRAVPPGLFGNPRDAGDWLWRPFRSDDKAQDGPSVAFVEELLRQGETLHALPIEKWSV